MNNKLKLTLVAVAVLVVNAGLFVLSNSITGYVGYKIGYKKGLSDMAQFAQQYLKGGSGDAAPQSFEPGVGSTR